MEYKVNFRWTSNGEKREVQLYETCREEGIYTLNDFWFDEYYDGSGCGNPDCTVCRNSYDSEKTQLEVKDLSCEFLHTPNKFIQEIADVFGVALEIKETPGAFGSRTIFIISGNDELLLPAWYWMVLALRANEGVIERFETFGQLLQQGAADAQKYIDQNHRLADGSVLGEIFYWATRVAMQSNAAWQLYREKKTTPTTMQMVENNECLLWWLKGKNLI